MLTLEAMEKVRAVCLQGRVQRVVSALYEFGAIQVTRSRQGEPDLPLPSFEAISEQLIALRAIESVLKTNGAVEARMPSELEKLLSESMAMRAEFRKTGAALEKIDSLKVEQARLRQERTLLAPFRGLSVPTSIFSKTEKLCFKYGLLKVSEKHFSEALKGKPAEASFVAEPGKVFALVAFLRDNPEVLRVLDNCFEATFEIPSVSEKKFSEAFKRVQGGLLELEGEKEKLLAEVEEFKKKNSAKIARLRGDLEEHAKQAELSNKFGKSDFLETIEGWIPCKHYSELQKALSEATGGKIFVEKVATREKAPSKLSNPPGIRRFEFLLSSFSLPDPQELDPTIFIAVSFPIIFGMIFGDIGYGLLTGAIGAFLRLKQKGFLQDMGGMMLLSGAWTVAFGFVFGEFFGGEEMLGYHLAPLVHRSGEGIALLFGLTLIVGIVHLALGLLIGFAANFRARHYSHAWAKLCWLLVEFALVAAIYSIVFKQPSLSLPALAALLAGAAGLYKFEGIQGIVELPSLLSNGLSYLRIMALGLSGVILALIVNQIPLNSAVGGLAKSLSGSIDPLTVLGALLTAAFLAIMVAFGHALALALGIFESGIQTLRLHYVEFFSKFYKGGGMPFLPLRERGA